MGTDKAALRLGGESLVGRAASALGSVVARTSLVSARDDARRHGLPLVRDVYAGLGAAGGLHAALRSCRAPWALVLACDLPFVTSGLLARLASFRGPGFDAIAPVQPDGRVQPLCALYSARACAATVEGLIEAGELRPRMLLGAVRARLVRFDEVADLPGAADFFRNVNTPEEFGEARRLSGETR